jgi:hypothetical protein
MSAVGSNPCRPPSMLRQFDLQTLDGWACAAKCCSLVQCCKQPHELDSSSSTFSLYLRQSVDLEKYAIRGFSPRDIVSLPTSGYLTIESKRLQSLKQAPADATKAAQGTSYTCARDSNRGAQDIALPDAFFTNLLMNMAGVFPDRYTRLLYTLAINHRTLQTHKILFSSGTELSVQPHHHALACKITCQPFTHVRTSISETTQAQDCTTFHVHLQKEGTLSLEFTACMQASQSAQGPGLMGARFWLMLDGKQTLQMLYTTAASPSLPHRSSSGSISSYQVAYSCAFWLTGVVHFTAGVCSQQRAAPLDLLRSPTESKPCS